MPYKYDEINGLIKINDETIYLTESENLVFKELYLSGKIPVSIEKINDIVFYGYMFRENTIRVIMLRLRKKLNGYFEIINIHKKGYILKYLRLKIKSFKNSSLTAWTVVVVGNNKN